MKKHIKSIFSGTEVEVIDQTFGKLKGIVQVCTKCNNDNFIVILMYYKKKYNIQLICPKCDTPHGCVTFSDLVLASNIKSEVLI